MLKKRMLIICLAVAATVCATLPALADESFTRIQKRVIRAETFCGRFTQTKQLAGIQKPVTSSGRFCVDKEKGILWRTLSPYQSAMRITRDAIVQYRGNKVVSRMSAQKQPAVAVMNTIFFSLASGDFAPLQRYFDVKANATPATWQVRLTEKGRSANEAGNPSSSGGVIKQITVTGDNYVKSLSIAEQNGDKTAISFSAFETGAGVLKPEDGVFYE